MSGRNPRRYSKVGLTVGFLALLAAVLLARRSPPTGYELSLYTATPPAVWAGLAVALVVGVAVSMGGDDRVSDAGLVLASAAVFVVVTLPLLRGYYFYGAGDALSHLGWIRELSAGSLAPVNLLYPGVHTTAVFVAAVTGMALRTALVFVVLACYTLVFLLFVPLCVALLEGSRLGLTLGVLAALLLAPINGVSVHPTAHPASQAILFFPFILFLALRYSTGPWRTAGSGAADAVADGGRSLVGDRVTAVGILLALASSAMVLIHPQQALNVVLFFAAIAAVQVLYRRRKTGHPITNHRPMYAQTAIVAAVFLLWAPRFQRVQEALVGTVVSIILRGPSAGTVVADKSVSLTTIGGSLPVLFLKLFLPGLVLSLLAAGLIAALLAGRLDEDRSDATSLLLYLTAALVPLFGVFLLLVASSAGDMYFRYQGFIMIPVTIIGAVALARLVRGIASGRRDRGLSTGARVAVVALFLMLVPIGAAALHASPYVYQANAHVPQSQVDGYAAAFEQRQPGTEFFGIRGGPRRYVDVVYGTERARGSLEFPGYRDGVNTTAFNRGSYAERYEDDRYLVVSDATYQREVQLYKGFRYSEDGFRALETTPGVNRVRANDGLRQYLIDGAAP